MGEAAADLISAEVVPPFVVVAVDSAGPMRSLNYLPYKPGGRVIGWPGVSADIELQGMASGTACWMQTLGRCACTFPPYTNHTQTKSFTQILYMSCHL